MNINKGRESTKFVVVLRILLGMVLGPYVMLLVF